MSRIDALFALEDDIEKVKSVSSDEIRKELAARWVSLTEHELRKYQTKSFRNWLFDGYIDNQILTVHDTLHTSKLKREVPNTAPPPGGVDSIDLRKKRDLVEDNDFLVFGFSEDVKKQIAADLSKQSSLLPSDSEVLIQFLGSRERISMINQRIADRKRKFHKFNES